jgi:hypothetical protein
MPRGNPPKGGGSTGGSGAVRGKPPRVGPRGVEGNPKGGKGPYGGR